ncbi:MAG: methionyl-tRNA formyltransferase [Prevotella sp.]|nr:methionyl-tRNA formyltransferase [Prevotella sp.]
MKKEELRIIFMGTPEFAVESLKTLVEQNYNVVAVVTQPDKPVGRHGSVLQASAVKQYALQHNIPVLQPEKMKDETFIEELKAFRADLQVVVAFRMLPEVVWAMPPFGTFNVHAALLPQYRGAAPINWAVINGEKQTGVTTFFLDQQIDTGKIIMKKTFDIPEDADAEYVYNGLMHLGAEICQETVDHILETDGNVQAMPQQEEGELKAAPKIFKDTCRINWQQKAENIYNFVRGLSPYPGTWTEIMPCDSNASQQPITLKIFKTAKSLMPATLPVGSFSVEQNRLFVHTQDSALEILELQMPGKKRMNSKEFLNGMRHIQHYHCISNTTEG